MDSYYDIYSTGELVNDANPAETRAAIARLFKTTEDKIAHLIAGKPQLIKRRVEKSEALRYKATLHQAGLMVSVKLSEAESSPSTTASTASQSAATQSAAPNAASFAPTTSAAKNDIYGFTIAPAGADILHSEEKTRITPREIDTSAIKLAPVSFMTETQASAPIATPDTRHLSIAEVGSLLGSETETPPLPAPDISHISVAELGAALDEIKPDVQLLNPDISGLSIAEAGVDLVPADYRKPAPPPPPPTDHIKLQTD
jgi:hypothetical protein